MRYQEPTSLPFTSEMDKRIRAVLESGVYTNGLFVELLEKEYKNQFGLEGECIAVNGCQSGLMLVLTALHVHRCLVPDFTFSATANAAYWACKSLVVADADAKTFNIRFRKLPRDVDGVMATHIFGNPCDCNRLKEQTEHEQVPVIYDAAHAHGAMYRGKPIGDQGVASVFSMSPTKSVTSGEGGMIVTKDKILAERLRILRNYGTEGGYEQTNPGLNARLSEFHAIIGLESLSRFWVNHRHRLDIVDRYLGAFPQDMTQKITPNCVHAWKDFTLLLGDRRNAVRSALEKGKYETRCYFRPISDLGCFKGAVIGQKTSMELYKSALQLPLHGNQSTRDADRIIEIVNNVTATTSP